MCLSATDNSTGSFAVFNSTLRLKRITNQIIGSGEFVVCLLVSDLLISLQSTG